MPPYLLWLALGAFAIGTEAFMIAGLLPAIARDLAVPVPVAGQLVTAFSLSYAISSPLLAVATGGVERKRLLAGAIAAFAIGNALAGLAESYATLFAARIALALAAGLFMPAASAYAVTAVGPERRGRAIALVYSGLTISTVIGVPLGALVGEHVGWRWTFFLVALLALPALFGILAALPRRAGNAGATLGQRIAVARRPEVLAMLGQTSLALGGAFTLYTYLAPFLARAAGIEGSSLAAVLLLFGLASAGGNFMGGIVADRLNPRRYLAGLFLLLAAVFSLMSVFALSLPPAYAAAPALLGIALWGLFGWSFPAVQQSRLVALDPPLSPVILSLNASATYVGSGLGAVLGSLVVSATSPAELGFAAAALELLGFALLMRSARRAAPALA